eukprot:TRINITY_DN7138_c0_g2_i1.p2 TRINITY_DN7138_c0_g2~~TRINITY_DN7138_c0_g2_i1.p2  ORF type:complete len:125 (-),score=0.40 TRINITY_DN7138_c0_g2_i1:285-659(-)
MCMCYSQRIVYLPAFFFDLFCIPFFSAYIYKNNVLNYEIMYMLYMSYISLPPFVFPLLRCQPKYEATFLSVSEYMQFKKSDFFVKLWIILGGQQVGFQVRMIANSIKQSLKVVNSSRFYLEKRN